VNQITFEKPLLFAVATYEHNGLLSNDSESKLRLRVLLCVPEEETSFDMILLWKSETEALEKNTVAFGRFLQVVSAFNTVRDKLGMTW
jgi:hypothetical protein